jgi:ligand-binding sensor domain-containing protein/signal transduction histidine kinase
MALSVTAALPENTPVQAAKLLSASPPANIRFGRLTTQEGLSQSAVHCMLQDSQGFMWFGTEDGLNRYDGYTFQVFRPSPDDYHSISDIWINAIFEDSLGYIWVGTQQGGLNRYDPRTGHFIHYLNDPLVQNSLSSNTVNAIQEDDDGNLWVGTDKGLDRFESATGTFKHFFLNPADIDAPLDESITTIVKASNGILWIGTADNGLRRFHPTTGSYRSYTHDPNASTTISDNRVNAIVEDRNGSLWIATENGLNLFDWETELFFHYHHTIRATSIASNHIFSLHLDNEGNLWIGTDNGLDFFDRQTRSFIHYRHDVSSQTSLSNDTVLSIYEDRGGILWFGTYGGGLNVYDQIQDMFQYFYHSNAPNSLSGNVIFPIYAAPDGIVWIGTFGEGLNRFDPAGGTFTAYQHSPEDPNSIQNDTIWSLLLDHAGDLWIGTSSGLDRLDLDTGVFQHFQNIAGDMTSITRGEVYAIFEDSRQQLWVGTRFGLNLYDPQTGAFEWFTHIASDPSSLSHNHVTTITEDTNGMLWIGTFGGGLNRLNPKTGLFTSYRHDPEDRISIGSNSILSIYQDSQETIWIGTFGGGLSRYDVETDTFDNFTTSDGLPNNVVYGILEDETGCLWLSTNYGLSRFDPLTLTFQNFTASDGLQGNEFSMHAYALSPDGKMYFGGINGITAFDPSQIVQRDYIPPIVLLSFTQDGKALQSNVPVEQMQEITLRWPQNGFEFEFAALSYGQSQQNQYAYMLENFDEEWLYVGTERQGRYTNLPGGDYVLRLKASNSDGVWNEEGISIAINIVPPFWQTTLFRVLAVLGLLGLAVVTYQVRVNNVKARSLELERMVRERTLALEKRTQEVEALYSADGRMLRTQTLQQVYQTLVDVAEEMFQASKSAVLTWNEKKTMLAVRVSRGFSPAVIRKLKFARGEGIIAKIARSRQPVMVNDLAADPKPDDIAPEIRAAMLSEGVSSFLHLPIAIDNAVIGVLMVGFTGPGDVNDDTVRLFCSLVQRAALSVENALLFEQTKQLAILEERNRLARDLHDSAKQKAFAALAQMGAVNQMLDDHQPAVKNHLEEAENLVYEVIQELTFLIQEIHPSALKDKGLASMLREYVFQWESRNDAQVNLRIENERRLPLEVEQAFYRIIQEALANITRHSEATRVEITLIYGDRNVEAEVADNGCGFDIRRKPAGLGLRSICERIESIHGYCQIDSAPGKGTRLQVRAPLTSLDQ